VTRGRFITVEGIEGVGKSSQIAPLVEVLSRHGHAPMTTREPGGTPVADRIRGLLLDPDGGAPTAETELLLLLAARAEHLEHRIRPALEAGQWVLCDRFSDATYAYQGGGRGLAQERIALLDDWVAGGCRPDLTVLLDAPVETALERARGRGAPDRFESETAAFFERARAVYRQRAAAEPARFRIIDATAPVEAVSAAIAAAVVTWLRAQAP
jgi:dTMP kinase